MQETTKNVKESVVSPILVENGGLREPGVMVAGPSHAKSPTFEKSPYYRDSKSFSERRNKFRDQESTCLISKRFVETTQA